MGIRKVHTCAKFAASKTADLAEAASLELVSFPVTSCIPLSFSASKKRTEGSEQLEAQYSIISGQQRVKTGLPWSAKKPCSEM